MESQRLCTGCSLSRTPDKQLVRKGSKKWIIFTCRVCKTKDIEEYTTKMVWNGNKLVKDDEDDEFDD